MMTVRIVTNRDGSHKFLRENQAQCEVCGGIGRIPAHCKECGEWDYGNRRWALDAKGELLVCGHPLDRLQALAICAGCNGRGWDPNPNNFGPG